MGVTLVVLTHACIFLLIDLLITSLTTLCMHSFKRSVHVFDWSEADHKPIAMVQSIQLSTCK